MSAFPGSDTPSPGLFGAAVFAPAYAVQRPSGDNGFDEARPESPGVALCVSETLLFSLDSPLSLLVIIPDNSVNGNLFPKEKSF